MNTKITNMIYVQDPFDEVEQWAKDNLIMPNPEYAKKERMGLWLGRTPRQLQLFSWHGHTLVLPFGVCRDVIEMLKKGTIECDFHQDDEIDYGDPDIGLYDYQKKAVISMIASKYGILKAKPGSGKTQMGISLIMAHKRRALWLCHTADLLNQSRDRALRYIPKDLIGTITEGKVAIGVDTGHHRAFLIAAPVGCRTTQHLHCLDRLRAQEVRTLTQIGEITLRIGGDMTVLQLGDQFAFITLSFVAEGLQGIFFGDRTFLKLLFLGAQLHHLVLNGCKTGVVDHHALRRHHIVIEPVLDSRTDTELNTRIQLLQRLRH